MFDLSDIGNAVFGNGFGSLIESFVGGEQAEQAKQPSGASHGLAVADQAMGLDQGSAESNSFWSNLISTMVESVFDKAKELGVSSDVQQQGYASTTSAGAQTISDGSTSGPGFPVPGDGSRSSERYGLDGDEPLYDYGQSSSSWGSYGSTGSGQDSVRDSIWSMMEKYDGDMQELLGELASAKSQTEVAQLQLEMQETTEKRKLMYELVSTMSRLDHEMAKTALENMGRA